MNEQEVRKLTRQVEYIQRYDGIYIKVEDMLRYLDEQKIAAKQFKNAEEYVNAFVNTWKSFLNYLRENVS